MKLFNILISVFFLLACFLTNAQQTSGTITYKLEVEGEGEDAIRLKENIAGSSVKVFFSPKAIRVQTRISAESINTSIIEKESGKVLVLVDKKKLKAAYLSNISEMSGLAATISDIKFTNETKTIQGYPCKKVTARDPHGNEVYYWYTEKIDFGIRTYQVPAEIPGVCLEYMLYAGTTKIVYTATEISKEKPDDNLFKLTVPEGFKLHSTGKAMNQEKEIEIRQGE